MTPLYTKSKNIRILSLTMQTGYLSLNSIIDYETIKAIQIEVYAIATVPLPRTATASVEITILDIDDVRPNVTVGDINMSLRVDNNLLQTVGITDPDSFPLVSADVSIIGHTQLQPSFFTGKLCLDEPTAITKMTSVCDLPSNGFEKLLSIQELGSDANQVNNEDNTVIEFTGTANSYLTSNADLSEFKDIFDELTLAFWIKPDTDGSGYIIFMSNEDGK